MAKSLKTNGLNELQNVRKRVERQLAFKRIVPKDADFLIKRLNECEAKIINMSELNEYGEEEV